MPGMGGQQGGYPPDADARSIDVQNLDQKRCRDQARSGETKLEFIV